MVSTMLANLEANMANPDAYDEWKFDRSRKVKPLEIEGTPTDWGGLSDHGVEQPSEGGNGQAPEPEQDQPEQAKGTEEGAKEPPKSPAAKPQAAKPEPDKGQKDDEEEGKGKRQPTKFVVKK